MQLKRERRCPREGPEVSFLCGGAESSPAHGGGLFLGFLIDGGADGVGGEIWWGAVALEV